VHHEPAAPFAVRPHWSHVAMWCMVSGTVLVAREASGAGPRVAPPASPCQGSPATIITAVSMIRAHIVSQFDCTPYILPHGIR
jgi:hypothetical protein